MNRLLLAISGMHCASCGLLIDDPVEDIPGVKRSQTDMRAERTTVELDGTGAGVAEVISAIEAEATGRAWWTLSRHRFDLVPPRGTMAVTPAGYHSLKCGAFSRYE